MSNTQTKTYEVFDHKIGGLLPDYAYTRCATDEGWVRLFYKCYPDAARGINMWTAVIRAKGADIYDHNNNVICTFVEVPDIGRIGQRQVR
jgi:hypothetical protein